MNNIYNINLLCETILKWLVVFYTNLENNAIVNNKEK